MSKDFPVPFVLWIGIWDGSQGERWNYALQKDIFNMQQFRAMQQRIGALGTNLAYFKRGYAPYWTNSQSAGGGTLYVKLEDSSRASGGWDAICTPLLQAVLSSTNGPFSQYHQYITGVMINVTQCVYSRICIGLQVGHLKKSSRQYT
uniref:Uncharacterized protein n=1 Tax=Ditylenchus dipsaci TaxID=166011 RepID=A0A915CML1_9BILA